MEVGTALILSCQNESTSISVHAVEEKHYEVATGPQSECLIITGIPNAPKPQVRRILADVIASLGNPLFSS